MITGAGDNFCSGGDVHEIIGPLTKLDKAGLLTFTQLTGDLVKAMRACPQPVIAAIDGVCVGAGAILAHGLRHSSGNVALQDRFPVYESRSRGLRHGRLRNTSAHHRSGPSIGVTFHGS